MTNGIAQGPPGTPRPKMTITVYTVTREGIVTAPRTTVAVSHDKSPRPPELSIALMPPCACPLHRKAGAAR
ncbi:hypothetical protein [Streptomyces bauhiniae]